MIDTYIHPLSLDTNHFYFTTILLLIIIFLNNTTNDILLNYALRAHLVFTLGRYTSRCSLFIFKYSLQRCLDLINNQLEYQIMSPFFTHFILFFAAVYLKVYKNQAFISDSVENIITKQDDLEESIHTMKDQVSECIPTMQC